MDGDQTDLTPQREFYRYLMALRSQDYRASLMQSPLGEPVRGPRGGMSMKGTSLWTHSSFFGPRTHNQFDFEASRLWRVVMDVERVGQLDSGLITRAWRNLVEQISVLTKEAKLECSAGPPEVLSASWTYDGIFVSCEAVIQPDANSLTITMELPRPEEGPRETLFDILFGGSES